MSLIISIPDEIAAVLGATAEERERRVREALALELYREGKISLRRVAELAGLGTDYWATDRLRTEHRVPLEAQFTRRFLWLRICAPRGWRRADRAR